MNFVYPSFLWAWLALAIPVIIHLFNFRRTIRVYFSNTRLLQQVKETTTQKRKVRQWLILAARLLFIFFLVLAFAQPYLPAREQVTSGRNVVLYVDNSYSMLAMADDKLRAVDLALQHARHIVDVFPSDTRFRVVTNDFAPFSNSFKTREEARDILAQVKLSPVSRTLQALQEKIKSATAAEEIFLISDFQQSTLGEALSTPDTLSQWHLVPVVVAQEANLSVDSVYLENPAVLGGERNAVHIVVRNSGTEARDHITVKFSLDGIQQGAVQMDLAPRSVASAQFDLSSARKSFGKGVISVQDFPVTFDNDFRFSLNSTQRIKVVELSPTGKPDFVSNVYGNSKLFNFRSFALSNVDFNVATQADLLIINGIARVDNFLKSIILRARVDPNSRILIIPSGEPDVASYSAALGISFTRTSDPIAQEALSAPDFTNPLFSNVFEERTRSMAMPSARAVWQWGADRSAPLTFSNGNPFLSSPGNLSLLAAPLDKEYSGFASHALFVPVMYRLASSGKRNNQPLYHYLAENFITLPVDSLTGEAPARLKGEEEIIPPQRYASGTLFLTLPSFAIKPGFYAVEAGGDTLSVLSFNADRQESILTPASEQDVVRLLGDGAKVSSFDAGSATNFDAAIRDRYLGTPLYKYMLWLALAFLLAEVLLIRFQR